MPDDLSLRPYTAADLRFLQRLYASTRADELSASPWPDEDKSLFLRQQLHARERHYELTFPTASHDVVMVDGEPAGRLMVERTPAQLLVVDIALLPQHRGRGHGSRLLGQLVDEAAGDRLPLRLHVDPLSAARRLYLRLGLSPVRLDGPHELMERLP